MHDCPAATMPGREQNTAVTAFVLDVFETVDQVGNTAKAEADADECGPSTITQMTSAITSLLDQGIECCKVMLGLLVYLLGGIPTVMFRLGQRSHTATRAINRGGGIL